jgi:hypothetical protein
MIKLKDILLEAGQEAGKLELVKTKPDTAKSFAEKIFQKNGRSLEEEIPNFDTNYKTAQKLAGTGKTLRKDMPVIDEKDVKDFQKRLQKGFIDVNPPHSTVIRGNDPFPEGLKGNDAAIWLQSGLPVYDKGERTDDVVKVSQASIPVKKLKPIQKQIYFDKSIGLLAKFGVEPSKSFMKKTSFITSNDNYIIDGHHRFLSAMLMDSNTPVNILKIDLPIKTLLATSLAYGDAVGNKRNA